MAKTISNRQLTPGETYLVRGKVAYSHITKLTTDEERAAANANRTYKIDKNYTSITLYDANVLSLNPQAPTIEEQYGLESLYNPKNADPNMPGKRFTGINKSASLPRVGVIAPTPNANTANYQETNLQAELAIGLDVTLVMRVFKGQSNNNGVTLDRVLVNEPLRYYQANAQAVDAALNRFNITFTAMPPVAEETAEADTAEPAPPASIASAAVPMQPVTAQVNPAAAPAQNNPFATASPSQGNPFGANPATVSAQTVSNQAAGPVTFAPGAARQY